MNSYPGTEECEIPPAIRLDDVTKRFSGVTVVNGVSLSIPVGARVGLVGPNGAGKSTTIRMLTGLQMADHGDFQIHGLNPITQRNEVRQMVGYVPDVHAFYRWMTVADVISFVQAMYVSWDDALVNRLFSVFQLEESKRVTHLSRGMAGKLSLLLALAHRPKVLILDEPLSGLDPMARIEFIEGMLSWGTVEQTVLFSSHELHDVQKFATHLVVMNRGRVLMSRELSRCLSEVRRIRAVLRHANTPLRSPNCTIRESLSHSTWSLTIDGFTPSVIDQLRSDHDLVSVTTESLTLEDLFVDLIKGAEANAG